MMEYNYDLGYATEFVDLRDLHPGDLVRYIAPQGISFEVRIEKIDRCIWGANLVTAEGGLVQVVTSDLNTQDATLLRLIELEEVDLDGTDPRKPGDEYEIRSRYRVDCALRHEYVSQVRLRLPTREATPKDLVAEYLRLADFEDGDDPADAALGIIAKLAEAGFVITSPKRKGAAE